MRLSSETIGRPITRRAVMAGAALTAPAILRAHAAGAAGTLNITAYDGFVPADVRSRLIQELRCGFDLPPARRRS
jgi:spermidine/putrescine-binding protein